MDPNLEYFDWMLNVFWLLFLMIFLILEKKHFEWQIKGISNMIPPIFMLIIFFLFFYEEIPSNLQWLSVVITIQYFFIFILVVNRDCKASSFHGVLFSLLLYIIHNLMDVEIIVRKLPHHFILLERLIYLSSLIIYYLSLHIGIHNIGLKDLFVIKKGT